MSGPTTLNTKHTGLSLNNVHITWPGGKQLCRDILSFEGVHTNSQITILAGDLSPVVGYQPDYE